MYDGVITRLGTPNIDVYCWKIQSKLRRADYIPWTNSIKKGVE